MIILIAESKTMTDCDKTQTPEMLLSHTPAGDATAGEVMAKVRDMTVADLIQTCKFSSAMASRELRMAYEFPNKLCGDKAIEAYTGVVFKSLDYSSFTADEKCAVSRDVRIISSLYGWLRPYDIIKPYRFDYTTPLAPGDRPFATYWRKDVTISLIRELKERGYTDLLNLLPADAAKAVDWKLVKRFAKVWKVDFKELRDGGDYATPAAGKLKKSRGELLRAIITSGIGNADELKTLATDSLLPLGTPVYPDHLTFCV